MKYIGPFLRINTLNKENVKNQLLHLSKESINNIVLNSKCGITIPVNELKSRNTPNFDISTVDEFSPLLCIYKKANPVLINVDDSLSWDEKSFKKEIDIFGNALMTLNTLELADYYKKFRDIDSGKYSLSILYSELAVKQLEFYASYLRNDEGVFVDKKNISEEFSDELIFEEKSKKFRFSNQAFIMIAFYKCSERKELKESSQYYDFSMDILNMFLQYKEELYGLSTEELCKLCLALNIFNKCSGNMDAKKLLLDLSDLLVDSYSKMTYSTSESQIEYDCMILINSLLIYKDTKIDMFKTTADNLYNKLIELYIPEKGIFVKDMDKKEIIYSCDEIILYLISIILYQESFDDVDSNDHIITDIFKRLVVESGILLSWPEVPDLNQVERYTNHISKADNLIEEKNFKFPTVATPESSQMASIFIKYLSFNRKKEEFKQLKTTFDSNKNMFLFFLIGNYLDYDSYNSPA